MLKVKNPNVKKEAAPKIHEERVAASLLPVLRELSKKMQNDNTAKEKIPEQPLTPDMIDLIIQQRLS